MEDWPRYEYQHIKTTPYKKLERFTSLEEVSPGGIKYQQYINCFGSCIEKQSVEAGKFTFGRIRIGDLERIAPFVQVGNRKIKVAPMPDGHCATWGVIAMHHTFNTETFVHKLRYLLGQTRSVTVGQMVAAIGSYIPLYTSITSSPVPYLLLWRNHCYYVFGDNTSLLDQGTFTQWVDGKQYAPFATQFNQQLAYGIRYSKYQNRYQAQFPMVFGSILNVYENAHLIHEQIAGLVQHFNALRKLNPHLYFVQLALCNYREFQRCGFVIGQEIPEEDCQFTYPQYDGTFDLYRCAPQIEAFFTLNLEGFEWAIDAFDGLVDDYLEHLELTWSYESEQQQIDCQFVEPATSSEPDVPDVLIGRDADTVQSTELVESHDIEDSVLVKESVETLEPFTVDQSSSLIKQDQSDPYKSVHGQESIQKIHERPSRLRTLLLHKSWNQEVRRRESSPENARSDAKTQNRPPQKLHPHRKTKQKWEGLVNDGQTFHLVKRPD